jgi:hypothetical protein
MSLSLGAPARALAHSVTSQSTVGAAFMSITRLWPHRMDSEGPNFVIDIISQRSAAKSHHSS